MLAPTPCPPNTSSRAENAYLSNCETIVSCDEGQFFNIDTEACDTCPAGYYCDGDNEKVLCAQGTYCEAGAIEETDCPLGKTAYFGSGSESECFDCPVGMRLDSDDKCVLCSAGYYCPDPTTTDKNYCGSGTYCPLNSAQPSYCPEFTDAGF